MACSIAEPSSLASISSRAFSDPSEMSKRVASTASEVMACAEPSMLIVSSWRRRR